MCQRRCLVGAALALLCAPVPVWASGSATLELVGARSGLRMTQNFRRIMRAGRARGYFERVRKRFAQKLAPLVKELDAKLPRLRGLALRSYDLRLPRVRCGQQGCAGPALARKSYPAVLVLPGLRVASDARHSYHLSLALSRAPTKKQVARAQKLALSILARRTSLPDVGYSMPLVVEISQRHGKVALQAHQAALSTQRQRRQLMALAKAALARLATLQRVAAKGKGALRFGRFSEALPYYDKSTKRFPARVSRGISDTRFHLHLQWAYARAADPKRRAAFSSRAYEQISALFTRRAR